MVIRPSISALEFMDMLQSDRRNAFQESKEWIVVDVRQDTGTGHYMYHRVSALYSAYPVNQIFVICNHEHKAIFRQFVRATIVTDFSEADRLLRCGEL